MIVEEHLIECVMGDTAFAYKVCILLFSAKKISTKFDEMIFQKLVLQKLDFKVDFFFKVSNKIAKEF